MQQTVASRGGVRIPRIHQHARSQDTQPRIPRIRNPGYKPRILTQDMAVNYNGRQLQRPSARSMHPNHVRMPTAHTGAAAPAGHSKNNSECISIHSYEILTTHNRRLNAAGHELLYSKKTPKALYFVTSLNFLAIISLFSSAIRHTRGSDSTFFISTESSTL